MARSTKYQEWLIEQLKDPEKAIAYLNEALEESLKGDQESQALLLLALRNVAEAHGGMGQLARKAGMGRESLYKTLSENGNPKWHTLVSLVNALGLHLRFGAPHVEMSDQAPLKLPFYETTVAAGSPTSAENSTETKVDLNELLIRHPDSTFFVRVEGTSMEGAGILSGDVIIVDRAEKAKEGSIVLAVINGEFTVKRLRREKNALYLMPENPKHQPLKVTEETDFEIWGVVIFVIHSCTR